MGLHYISDLHSKAGSNAWPEFSNSFTEPGKKKEALQSLPEGQATVTYINEPPRGKTNNVVSEQVRYKSGCTVIEDS